MLQKRSNNFLIISLALIAFSSFATAEVIEGKSGEIIAIPSLSKNHQDKFIIKQGSKAFQLISLPFVKNDLLITRHDVDVRVKQVNFGVSRVTIRPSAGKTVNPSKDDLIRANNEAILTKTALSTSTKTITPSFQFVSPVPGVITSPFGKDRFYNTKKAPEWIPKNPHLALDLAGSEGTPINAPLKGIVVLVGDFFYTGHTLILDHGYGLFSSYSHMSETKVKVGDFVGQSSLIGLVGSTGRVTGPHLHWTVYFDGNKVNPESLVKDGYLSTLLKIAVNKT